MLRRWISERLNGSTERSNSAPRSRSSSSSSLVHQQPEEQADSDLDEAQLESIALAKRFKRRQAVIDSIVLWSPKLGSLLILAGFVAGFILPTDFLSRSTYISENAILPGQVNTYWGWAQVHKADRYADMVDEWRHLPSDQRASRIKDVFKSLGLRSQTQAYSFSSPLSNSHSISNGTNVHAVLHTPRTDGSEALVLMASWLTRRPGSDVRGGDVNVRGVSSVLALAEYLLSFNLWSKDIIFLIADEFLEGTHAWLKSYHGVSQSNLEMEDLELRTGSIWAALNLDYPFHSFSHIGIEYEGIDGQLPNLDFINTVANIVRWTGSCPITIHDGPLEPTYPHYLPDHPQIEKYVQAGRTITKQMVRGLVGSPSGPEGIFSSYRIDAVALFGHPADGPHGFHTLGKIVESTLRSLNNLLERFHQSFFLYLLQSSERFLSVAMYLIVPLLLGVGLTVKGLAKWGSAGEYWSHSKDQRDPTSQSDPPEKVAVQNLNRSENEKGAEILWSLKIIGLTHVVGAGIYWSIIRSMEPKDGANSSKLYGAILMFSILPLGLLNFIPPRAGTSVKVFEPIQLMLSGCFVSVTSVLNFPLGTGLGVILGLHPIGLVTILLISYSIGLFDADHRVGRDWKNDVVITDQILQSWFLSFCLIILSPLWIQSLLVQLLKKFY